jgi:hypothetical protein
MSDSLTVTIPATEPAATAETQAVRLLRALADNPEPLTAAVLAGLLAEPGRRRKLLPSCRRILHRHEQAGLVERAGRGPRRRGRPATVWRITLAGRGWLVQHDQAPALAVAAAARARRSAAERAEALAEARTTFDRETPRLGRKRAAQRLRDLGCTLEEIGAVFHVSKERIRQDLLWDPAAQSGPPQPRRRPKPRQRLTPRQAQVLLELHHGRQAKSYPHYTHTLRTLKNRGLVTYTASTDSGSMHGYTITAEGHAIASELGGIKEHAGQGGPGQPAIVSLRDPGRRGQAAASRPCRNTLRPG